MRPALPQNVLMMDEVESGESRCSSIGHHCGCVQVALKLACTCTHPPTWFAEQSVGTSTWTPAKTLFLFPALQTIG
jgi:hypothetical protein